MKKFAKFAALAISIGGAVGLGYLISVISNLSLSNTTGIILIVATLFFGGAIILGTSIYLFFMQTMI